MGPYFCDSPRCGGPSGHACRARHNVGLPKGAYRVLSCLKIDTDLFSHALAPHAQMGISRWFSRAKSDLLVGSEGNSLDPSVSWAGLKALIHPPSTSVGWRVSVWDKMANALSSPGGGFLVFDRMDLWPPIGRLCAAGMRFRLLGTHPSPRWTSQIGRGRLRVVEVGPHAHSTRTLRWDGPYGGLTTRPAPPATGLPSTRPSLHDPTSP